MIIFGNWENHPLIISIKPNCLTVGIEYPDDSSVFSFDYQGRLWTAMVKDTSYRRGLDGKIIAKWILPGSTERKRRWLHPYEADNLLFETNRIICQISNRIQSGIINLSAPLPAQAKEGFQKITEFGPASYSRDVTQYHQVYKPVGILPPDQYMAVVLQATEGCSFNTCTFCSFYKDRPFCIKTPLEFSDHSRRVKEYLGPGLSLRRTLFLGDANALVIPMPRLLEIFEITHSFFDVESLGGIYVFMDGFSGDKKTIEDYEMLAKRGLKRVYIGLESGNQQLTNLMKKPGSPHDVISAVQRMKNGGVAVGVIALLGAGGHKYARSHVKDTIQAINEMHLDAEDILYFSDLVESEGMSYTKNAFQDRWQPLSPEECVQQREDIENNLVFSEVAGTPHICRYDIREFVY
jgi:hypothetical protein